ncbi:MAG: sortase [Clostridia bacterium]|nr:sortase [Clostridia bacterium]
MDNQEKNITETTEVSTETAKAPEAKKTEKKKSSGNGPVRIAILVVCLAVFAFSGYKIISEFMDGADTEDMYENLQEAARGDEDENAEDSKDDVNVPPAPIDPNVSGSGGVVENETEDNTETPDSSETVENNENTETPDASGEASAENTETPDSSEATGSENAGTQTQPQTPSTDTVQNNDTYADRTYEEELAEQEQMKEEEDTQYYVSRKSSDKEKTQTGVKIRPEDIDLDDVPYLKVSNLDSFKKVNEETVGWIYVPGSKQEAKGTPIDTTIVQTTDNEYYLTHTFDKKENINGWIYADYRCNMDSVTSNYNTVIYGHARSYKMFGGLKDLDEAVEWYSNGNNHFIKINTFKDETVWQIFSWYETDIYFDYIKTDFKDSNDFIRFAYEVQGKNQMTGAFETFDFNEDDRILTLSTCKGFDRAVRVAVHAKLVKRNPIG